MGFRLGRWDIGSKSDPEAWLAFSGVGTEPSVAYALSPSECSSAYLSLRLHNIKQAGTVFGALETGRHTIVGRAVLNYKVDRHWTAGLEATQDLLGKGDGATLSAGLSRSFRLGERGQISPSAGITWGSGQHWRSAYTGKPLAASLHAGVGNIGLGLGYREAISSHWGWYGSLSASRPVGQIAQISTSGWGLGAQAGLQYFGAL